MGDIQIIYRAGKDNALADALSRNPQGPPPEDGIAEGESQVAVIDGDGIAEGDSPVSKQLLQLTPTPPQVDNTPMIVEEKRDPVVRAMVQFLKKGILPEKYQVISKKIARQATQFEVVNEILCFIDLK